MTAHGFPQKIWPNSTSWLRNFTCYCEKLLKFHNSLQHPVPVDEILTAGFTYVTNIYHVVLYMCGWVSCRVCVCVCRWVRFIRFVFGSSLLTEFIGLRPTRQVVTQFVDNIVNCVPVMRQICDNSVVCHLSSGRLLAGSLLADVVWTSHWFSLDFIFVFSPSIQHSVFYHLRNVTSWT